MTCFFGKNACWRGRPLHCTGRQQAAGSGRLLGGWRTGSSLAWTTSTLHGPPTGSRLRPAAGGWSTGSSLAWTTSTLHWPPTGGRLRPSAGGWSCGMLSQTTSSRPWPPTGSRPCWLSGGDTCSSACAEESFCTRAAAWQPALTGCGWLRAAPGYRHGSHTVLHLQHIPPRGSPSLALIGPLAHLRL